MPSTGAPSRECSLLIPKTADLNDDDFIVLCYINHVTSSLTNILFYFTNVFILVYRLLFYFSHC